MADPRRVELDDLINRPGTYFPPQSEVLIVFDDAAELDAEIFASVDLEDTDWVLISDEVPVDEHRRDVLLEKFAVQHSGGLDDEDEDDDEDEEDELEPDPEEDE
jgi:hypothetical protein